MARTPASLLERLRRPEEHEAWGRFVELYTPLLFAWARRLGVPLQEVPDLVQDVLVLLVRKLPQFTYDPSRSFRAWLRTVLINRWRQSCRAGHAPEVVAELAELQAPDALGPQEEAEYRSHLVRRALEQLAPAFPPRTWEAFRRYVVDGQPPAQVAAELHLNLGTVYAAKSRILTRLRRELDGLLE
jgi:RNA polymerase sigma-70 factor (ECF subfamily)